MRNGLQRLLDNAPGILVTVAVITFLGGLANASMGAYVGYNGPHTLLRLASMIIGSAYAPALMIGLAATVHYLRQSRPS